MLILARRPFNTSHLDIYAGSLTRYYCGAWENVVEQQAKKEGFTYKQISPDGPANKNETPAPAEVEPAILAWRDAVTKGLGENIDVPLDWIEGVESPYSTDRPGYPGYSGLEGRPESPSRLQIANE